MSAFQRGHFFFGHIACLYDQNKRRFWRAGFFPANQGFLKTLQIARIGWIKAGPPK